MHALRFRSDNPLDHLPRALDQLRRMGLELHRATIEGGGGDGARIRVLFSAEREGAAQTYGHRMGGLVGISELHLKPVRGAKPR